MEKDHHGKCPDKEELVSLVAYGTWHIWNERNRRVFKQKKISPLMLIRLINDDYGLIKEAKEL